MATAVFHIFPSLFLLTIHICGNTNAGLNSKIAEANKTEIFETTPSLIGESVVIAITYRKSDNSQTEWHKKLMLKAVVFGEKGIELSEEMNSPGTYFNHTDGRPYTETIQLVSLLERNGTYQFRLQFDPSNLRQFDHVDPSNLQTIRIGKKFDLRPKTISDWNQTVTVLASVIGSILAVSAFIILRVVMLNIRGRQRLAQLEIMLKANEQTEFDPTLPIFENIDKGPKINPNFQNNLKVDTLMIDRRNVVMLGEGNFGVVLQVKHRKSDGSLELLALKRPKCNFEVHQYVMLYKEICLMTFLGKHPNIVNMIGFINDISHGQLYLVMELCTDGSLENLLKSVRVDVERKFFSELRDLYQNVPGGSRYLQEDFPDWPLIKAAHKGYIFHSDLISYAYQVALAMEYLAQLSFVHRDLAARNILLGNNFKVAKIGDFGLGRQIYNQKYKFFDKENNLAIPIRWTAPESLIYKEFSSGSDVWSFGVLIGEIFSLGELPFSHVIDSQFDPVKLMSGEITPKRPFLASDNICQLMLKCCAPERPNRINFNEAKSKLREEFERCSSDQLVSLKALLSEIRQQLEVPIESESNVVDSSV